MNSIATGAHPSGVRRRLNLLLRGTLCLLLLATLTWNGSATAHAAGGTLVTFGIEVSSDGSGSSLDTSTDNGVVASNEQASFRWRLTTDGVDDAILTQTLPECWKWDPTSLGALSSTSSLYSASHTISADGRTLTATVSVPSGGNSDISLSNLAATPSGTCTNNSTYVPTLSVTDASGARTARTRELTVVNERRLDAVKTLRQNNASSTCNVGDGVEQCRQVQYEVTVRRPVGTDRLGAADVDPQLPLVVRDTFQITAPAPRLTVVSTGEGAGTLENYDPATGKGVVRVQYAKLPADFDANGASVQINLRIPTRLLPPKGAVPLTLSNRVDAVDW